MTLSSHLNQAPPMLPLSDTNTFECVVGLLFEYIVLSFMCQKQATDEALVLHEKI